MNDARKQQVRRWRLQGLGGGIIVGAVVLALGLTLVNTFQGREAISSLSAQQTRDHEITLQRDRELADLQRQQLFVLGDVQHLLSLHSSILLQVQGNTHETTEFARLVGLVLVAAIDGDQPAFLRYATELEHLTGARGDSG